MTDEIQDPARILFVMSEAVLAMDLAEMVAESGRPAIGEIASTIGDAKARLGSSRPAALFFDAGALRRRGVPELVRKASCRVPLVCVGGGVERVGVDVPAHTTLDLPFDEGSVSALVSSLINV